MVNVIIYTKQRKCYKCGNTSYAVVNGKPLCIKHFVEEYYGKNKGCLESYLDSLIDDIDKGRKLTEDEVKLLKEIKNQLPGIAEEFPRLFKGL